MNTVFPPVVQTATLADGKPVFHFKDWLHISRAGKRATEEAGAGGKAERILLVTLDDDLYFFVRDAAVQCGWELWRASGIEQGTRLLDESGATVVIYDRNPVSDDWQSAVSRFASRPDHPCVLLASSVIDENLLTDLAGRGGFGAISRAATAEHLIRSVRFAHFSLRHPNPILHAEGISSGHIHGGRPFQP